jgi:hypothetical protein
MPAREKWFTVLSRDQTYLGRNFCRSDVSTREVWNITFGVYMGRATFSPFIERNFWYHDQPTV